MRTADELIRYVAENGPLDFAEFMELALYSPLGGYYSGRKNPIGREGDFITAPHLSPIFAYALSGLVRDLVALEGDEVCAIVDIGCGEGSLLSQLRGLVSPSLRMVGVDRCLGRAVPDGIEVMTALPPLECNMVVIANELYDAFPVRRVVQRASGLTELLVRGRGGILEWTEAPAGEELRQYLGNHSIDLEIGQFADFSLQWSQHHCELLQSVRGGLIVVIDYGNVAKGLFDPRARRWGTVASYRRHQVSREVLAGPGEQDITAHVNFTDLMRAGEAAGWDQLYFGRLAPLLLSLGAADHPAFRSADHQQREDARRLVLPDGMGDEMMVLVQGRGVPLEGWRFQQKLW